MFIELREGYGISLIVKLIKEDKIHFLFNAKSTTALANSINSYKRLFLRIIYLVGLRRFEVKSLNYTMVGGFMGYLKKYHAFKQEALPSIRWSSLLFYSKQ